MQQLDAEVVFQLLDALGDRRLRQIENLGRLADRAGLDHGGKIAQLTELHGESATGVIEKYYHRPEYAS